MAKLNEIVALLEDQRRELVNQLEAIDRAIAALGAAGTIGSDMQEHSLETSVDEATPAVLARRVKAKRVLSDSHKQAVSVAKRKARGAQDAAKGLAREMLDDDFVPAIGERGGQQLPRLVRRPIKK